MTIVTTRTTTPPGGVPRTKNPKNFHTQPAPAFPITSPAPTRPAPADPLHMSVAPSRKEVLSTGSSKFWVLDGNVPMPNRDTQVCVSGRCRGAVWQLR